MEKKNEKKFELLQIIVEDQWLAELLYRCPKCIDHIYKISSIFGSPLNVNARDIVSSIFVITN